MEWEFILHLFYALSAAALVICVALAVSKMLGHALGNTAEMVTLGVLTATGVILYLQLSHIRDQGEMQRIVASRNSLQEMNKIILDNKETFLPLLYPDFYKGVKPEQDADAKAEATTEAEATADAAALVLVFSALNAWEVVYHIQKEDNLDAFTKLLARFVKDRHIGETWKNEEEIREAYDSGFRKVMKDILDIKEDAPTTAPRP